MRIDNADELPYYVMEGARPVQVRFVPLEAGDETAINDMWPGAIYFELWRHVALYNSARETTLKLVTTDGSDSQLLGLLKLGDGTPARSMAGKLNTQSVLETAPSLRYPAARRYKGVGKILVARLIAESILQHFGGAHIVTPRPQTYPFYLHLGFQPVHRVPKLFFLRKEVGTQLLKSVLLESEEKKHG